MFWIKTINKIKDIQNTHLNWHIYEWDKLEFQKMQNKKIINEISKLYIKIELMKKKPKDKEVQKK